MASTHSPRPGVPPAGIPASEGSPAFVLAALLLLLLIPPLAAPSASGVLAQEMPEADLAIVGGHLIDGNEGPPVRDAVILVSGERIVHVGTTADTPVPPGAEVIDANGFTVLPGLHDTHVHLMIAGHGIYPDYFPRWGDRLRDVLPASARALLMAGVTSARDLGMPLEEALWIRSEIEEGRLPGPRLFVSGPFLQKTTSGYDDAFRWRVEGAEDARGKAERLADAGVDLLKVIQLAQLTSAEREAIAGVARERDLHIAVHAWDLEEHRLAAEMGAATIEHVGGGPGPTFDAESVRLMAESGIAYVPTNVVMRVYEETLEWPERLDDPRAREGLPEEIWRDIRASIEHPSRLAYFDRAKEGFSPENWSRKTRQLWEGGVRLLVGTDSGTPMNFHHGSTCREMDLLTRYGIPPLKVISMATRHPARLYGMGDELGTVEPGRLADLILVRGDPLRNMAVLCDVEHVVKGGVQVK